MRFKSPQQPFCRWCGKKITKHGSRVWIKREEAPTDRAFAGGWGRNVYIGDTPFPTNKAELQRHTNQHVLSYKYEYELDDNKYILGEKAARTGKKWIDSFEEWDGESYTDPFFCSGDHAKEFGYAAAQKGFAMPAYNEAIKKRRGAA